MLVPLNYARGERFDHDPALKFGAVPRLEAALDLAAAPAELRPFIKGGPGARAEQGAGDGAGGAARAGVTAARQAAVKAALQVDYGSIDAAVVVTEVPTPVPGPGEVLIRMQGTTLNRKDLFSLQNLAGPGIRPRPPLPHVNGGDGFGDIVENRSRSDGLDSGRARRHLWRALLRHLRVLRHG